MNSPNVLQEMIFARRIWEKATEQHRKMTALKVARDYAKKNKANPFAFETCYNHLMNNVYVPEDYASKKAPQ